MDHQAPATETYNPRISLALGAIGISLFLIDRLLFDSLMGLLVSVAIWGVIFFLPLAIAYWSRNFGWANAIAVVLIIAAVWDLGGHSYTRYLAR